MPLFDPKYFVGALVDAHEGHVDPAGVTHAYAKAARAAGAEVYRNTWARAIERNRDGGWRVLVYDTASGEDLGAVECEHVVNCGGLWAREVGRMVGLELPVLAMEHTYLVTEPLEAVRVSGQHNRRTGSRLMHVIDFGGEIYMRQEGEGMLLGTYEQACLPWSPRQTPEPLQEVREHNRRTGSRLMHVIDWDFARRARASMRLLPPDLDRISESLEVAFAPAGSDRAGRTCATATRPTPPQ